MLSMKILVVMWSYITVTDYTK